MSAPLLDLAAARAARDVGVARAGAGSSSAFLEAAYSALSAVARRLETFIVDDVWEAMGPHVPTTRDRRAMGSVMQRGVREGLIVSTDLFRASAQRQCHANPRRVWARAVGNHSDKGADK